MLFATNCSIIFHPKSRLPDRTLDCVPQPRKESSAAAPDEVPLPRLLERLAGGCVPYQNPSLCADRSDRNHLGFQRTGAFVGSFVGKLLHHNFKTVSRKCTDV